MSDQNEEAVSGQPSAVSEEEGSRLKAQGPDIQACAFSEPEKKRYNYKLYGVPADSETPTWCWARDASHALGFHLWSSGEYEPEDYPDEMEVQRLKLVNMPARAAELCVDYLCEKETEYFGDWGDHETYPFEMKPEQREQLEYLFTAALYHFVALHPRIVSAVAHDDGKVEKVRLPAWASEAKARDIAEREARP